MCVLNGEYCEFGCGDSSLAGGWTPKATREIKATNIHCLCLRLFLPPDNVQVYILCCAIIITLAVHY